MDQKLEMLRGVPLFSGLGNRELEEVGMLADEVDVPAGRVLCEQGRSGEEFFVVLDGAIRIDRDGSPVRTLGAGDFLGEIALIDHGPRSGTATAETPARLLVIAHREFDSLLDRFPAIEGTIMRTLANRVRRLDPGAGE